MKKRITFLLFPQFQLLDAAGPISAFEIAERYVPGTYELKVVAGAAGAVPSTAGASLNASGLPRAAGVDTLLIAGGEGSRSACQDARLLKVIARCGAARRPRRT